MELPRQLLLTRRRVVLGLLSAAIAGVSLGASALTQAPATGPSSTVILISFDGWRWDYLDRYQAPNLRALAERGVRAEGLIPAFPSVTYPNHYTLVTGLYPDHHGVINNSMVDPAIGPERFTMSSDAARDRRWWGGEPIWTTVVKRGGKSASMFWPGSEAIHPTYWLPYDGSIPNAARVAKVLDWLRLPDAERPSFVTLYFSDVDSAGHRNGPDAPETAAAVARVDASLGELVEGLRTLGILDRTTIVVTSDHGMIATSSERTIYLSDYLDVDTVEVRGAGAMLALDPRSATTTARIVEQLTTKHPALTVYPKERLPKWLHYGTHPRVPAVIGLMDAGWSVSARRPEGAAAARHGGSHGYSPEFRDMHGLLVAAGPGLRRGAVVPAIDNVHVYPLLCRALGLRPAPHDGDAARIDRFFSTASGVAR